MKLIIENWRQYLTESEMQSQIAESWKQYLTEEQVNEAMPKWMKKLGTGAALAATLAGAGAPSQAYAGEPGQDADAPAQQQKAPKLGPSVDDRSYTARHEINDDLQAAMKQSDEAALVGMAMLVDAVHMDPGLPLKITSRTQVGGYVYSTAGFGN